MRLFTTRPFDWMWARAMTGNLKQNGGRGFLQVP
jgi:hypothetical protein